MRVHSLLSQGRQNGGTGGQVEGLLICLTGLWPKVSCHIPAPAGPLSSPKHGAARREKEARKRGAGEAPGRYKTVGQLA